MKQLTRQEKNRLLATAAGWKNRLATLESPVERCGMRLPNAFGHPIEAWWHETAEEHRGVYAMPPDFYDRVMGLWHCHCLERTLDPKHRLSFAANLPGAGISMIVSSTAAERADTLLLSLKLATEEQLGIIL